MSPMLNRITLAEREQLSERQKARAKQNRQIVVTAVVAMIVLWSIVAMILSYQHVVAPCAAC